MFIHVLMFIAAKAITEIAILDECGTESLLFPSSLFLHPKVLQK